MGQFPTHGDFKDNAAAKDGAKEGSNDSGHSEGGNYSQGDRQQSTSRLIHHFEVDLWTIVIPYSSKKEQSFKKWIYSLTSLGAMKEIDGWNEWIHSTMMEWIFFHWVKTVLSWDMFCPITHPVMKWGTITRARLTLAPKCRREIVLSPVVIFRFLLKTSISRWAHFALMTPEQLLQAAALIRVERHAAKERERDKECIEVCECSPLGAIRGQV